jgi:hypothetical protein
VLPGESGATCRIAHARKNRKDANLKGTVSSQHFYFGKKERKIPHGIKITSKFIHFTVEYTKKPFSVSGCSPSEHSGTSLPLLHVYYYPFGTLPSPSSFSSRCKNKKRHISFDTRREIADKEQFKESSAILDWGHTWTWNGDFPPLPNLS